MGILHDEGSVFFNRRKKNGSKKKENSGKVLKGFVRVNDEMQPVGLVQNLIQINQLYKDLF